MDKEQGIHLVENKKVRTPLAPIQNKGTGSENEMVGRKLTSVKKCGEALVDKTGRVTKATSNKIRSGFAGGLASKIKLFADTGIQTVHPDILLISADEPPVEYWKQLAETRGKALEESLQENEILHKRIEELEADKYKLEDMLQDAKGLAEMLSSLADNEDTDESGFGADDEEDNL